MRYRASNTEPTRSTPGRAASGGRSDGGGRTVTSALADRLETPAVAELTADTSATKLNPQTAHVTALSGVSPPQAPQRMNVSRTVFY
jgi:hypothetical protein